MKTIGHHIRSHCDETLLGLMIGISMGINTNTMEGKGFHLVGQLLEVGFRLDFNVYTK